MNNFMNETKIASFLKWAKERKRFLIGFGAVFGVIFAVMLTQMRVIGNNLEVSAVQIVPPVLPHQTKSWGFGCRRI